MNDAIHPSHRLEDDGGQLRCRGCGALATWAVVETQCSRALLEKTRKRDGRAKALPLEKANLITVLFGTSATYHDICEEAGVTMRQLTRHLKRNGMSRYPKRQAPLAQEMTA